MKDNTIAIFGLVPFGIIKIEGYLLPEKIWTKTNKFGISKTQAVILAYPTFDRNNAAAKFMQLVESRKAKEIAPKGFSVHAKTKTDAGQGEAAFVDLLPVDQLIPFLKLCKRMKSKVADTLIEDLAGLSVQQIFSDAFAVQFGVQERQNWLFEWQTTRSMARLAHLGFADACIRKRHPGNLVHDYMTVLIFGDTAKAARMKALVADNIDLDPTIGLNHQSDIEGMRQLANAKGTYIRMSKGTWQEQVERAVANSR